MSKPLLQAYQGHKTAYPPIWLMRQAGRHLPEYLQTRAKAKDFIDFCFRPDLASEATLQPIRRYDMDGAILFADILLIPIGLGREVTFEKGVGPRLDPLELADISQLKIEGAADRISAVFETVKRVKAGLPEDKTLIGFAGGPWTVATYMLEGRGTPDKEKAKRFAYEHPEAMEDLLFALAEASIDYLEGQYRAGADCLKIFESWAEGLSPSLFEQLVLAPTQHIVSGLRERGVDCPIIGFPRGAGLHAPLYAHESGVDALACGTDVSLSDMRAVIPDGMPLQGNLDPLLLRMGGRALEEGVSRVLEEGLGGPHIFNLGHGVTPDVKIENVHQVINLVRGVDA